MSWTVDVDCVGSARAGWTCFVAIRGGDGTTSEHEVRVRPEDLAALAPAATEPRALVERSFAFLLAREPPSSILRSFDLLTIGRYYPEYEATIRAG